MSFIGIANNIWRGTYGTGGSGRILNPAAYFNGATTLSIDPLVATSGAAQTWVGSFWFKSLYHVVSGQSRSRWTFFQSRAINGVRPGGSTIYQEDSGTLFFYFRNPTHPGNGSGVMKFNGSPNISLEVWHHLVASVDVSGASAVFQLYIDDQEVTLDDGFVDGTLPFDLDFYTETFYIQDWMLVGDTQPAFMSIYDFWFAGDQYLDLSVTANRRKFVTADLKPVNLGPTGLLPTGVAPDIYMTGGASDFVVNRGTGGTFTLAGQPLVTVEGPAL